MAWFKGERTEKKYMKVKTKKNNREEAEKRT